MDDPKTLKVAFSIYISPKARHLFGRFHEMRRRRRRCRRPRKRTALSGKPLRPRPSPSLGPLLSDRKEDKIGLYRKNTSYTNFG